MGYIVEKRASISKTWEKVVTIEPEIRSFTIQNLRENKEYFFRIYSENPIGISEPLESGDAVRLMLDARKSNIQLFFSRYLLLHSHVFF